jgi:glutaredoxin 3
MSVQVYSTPTCGYCNLLKKYLRERGVQFTDYNVANDIRKAEEMVHKSRQMGVPVTDINGTIIVGFDRARIDSLLARVKN